MIKHLQNLSLKKIFLTGLIVLLLFFCIALGICLHTLLTAQQTAIEADLLNRSAVEMTSIAEVLKSCDGTMDTAGKRLRSRHWYDADTDSLTLYYDESLQPSSKNGSSYQVEIAKETASTYHTYTIHMIRIVDNTEINQLEFKALRTKGGGKS